MIFAIKIENWGLVELGSSPFQAPEARPKGLHGQVVGHPRFPDGESVTTSALVNGTLQDGKVFVTTASGSVYELGKVSDEYEALYPGALERLTRRFV